ncbi:ankyrin repeat-containing domain protein [Baffinella frigidus]|nr:ankyrin repeat-containing domain protein [Cryptophyta sp. CCMP2293]
MVWTPLHTAARDGDTARLRRCVESIKWREPVDVNSESATGHTPLHMCSANGHLEMMQFIISHKGCVKDSVTNQGNTALHLAALNDREPACKLLINNGVDVRLESDGKPFFSNEGWH